MKTFMTLKEVFRGETMAVLGFILYMEIHSHFTETYIAWDLEDICIVAGWYVFTIVMTYVLYILKSGIMEDVADIIKTIKEKKVKKA